MNPELQKELFTRLDVLAAKLGVAAQSLWQIYAQQARVALIEDYIIIVVCLLPCLVLVGCIYVSKSRYYDEWPVAAIISIIAFFGFMCAISEIIQIKLNVNYWILHHILNSLSQ